MSFVPCLWLICGPNWYGFVVGETVLSEMSLGRKNSMYESFKGAPGTQFRGFYAASQLHFLCNSATSDDQNFLIRPLFWVFLDSMESPLSLQPIHIYFVKI